MRPLLPLAQVRVSLRYLIIADGLPAIHRRVVSLHPPCTQPVIGIRKPLHGEGQEVRSPTHSAVEKLGDTLQEAGN